MSLINEALKKAQHQRTGNPVDLPPMPGSSLGAHGVRRGKALPAQTLAWIVGGSLAAVVVAVLITVALVTRHSPEPAPAARPAPVAVTTKLPAATPTPAAAPAASTPVPVITVPAVKIDLSSGKLPPADTVAAAPAEPNAAPASAPVAVAPPATAPVKPKPGPAAPAVVESAPAAAPAGQDIRILTLVDSLRVAGIRSSGHESKVLMNDRVYRVNDLVDYALGVRLTKVSADGLTFTDANGTTYVKNF